MNISKYTDIILLLSLVEATRINMGYIQVRMMWINPHPVVSSELHVLPLEGPRPWFYNTQVKVIAKGKTSLYW